MNAKENDSIDDPDSIIFFQMANGFSWKSKVIKISKSQYYYFYNHLSVSVRVSSLKT